MKTKNAKILLPSSGILGHSGSTRTDFRQFRRNYSTSMDPDETWKQVCSGKNLIEVSKIRTTDNCYR